MRKIHLFAALPALLILSIACSKNTPDSQLIEKTFTFASDPVMRTSLDGLQVKWQAGDKIAIIPKGSTTVYAFTLSSGENSTSASFSGTCTAGEDNTYYAFYPYDSGTEYYINGGTTAFITKFSAVQTAVAGSFPTQTVSDKTTPVAFMAAECTDGSTFHMKNLLALLKFRVGADDITQVSFLATSSESKYLAGGKFTSAYPFASADSTGVWGQGGSGRSTSVNVLPPAGETTFTQGVDYYAAVNTTLGAISSNNWIALESKISWIVRTASKYAIKSSSKTYTLGRNRVYNIGIIGGTPGDYKTLTKNDFDVDFSGKTFYKSSSGDTTIDLPTAAATSTTTIYPVISGSTRTKCTVGSGKESTYLWDETNTSLLANDTKKDRIGIRLVPLKYKAITKIVVTVKKVEGDDTTAEFKVTESYGSGTDAFGSGSLSLSDISNGQTKTIEFNLDSRLIGNSACVNCLTKNHIQKVTYTLQ